MKFLKILAVAAITAAALTTFVASASAATFTSPTGTTYSGNIEASAGSVSIDGAFTTVTCNKSSLSNSISSQGAGQTIKVIKILFTFNECNFPVSVSKLGTEEYHSIRPNIVAPHVDCLVIDGDTCPLTVTASGTEIIIITSVGSCTFTTANTTVGVLTTTAQTGGKAVLDINGKLPRTGGNFLCGSSGTWTGSYTVNTPSTLWGDA